MKKRKSFEATTGHRIYTCIDGELFGNDEVRKVVVVDDVDVVEDDDVVEEGVVVVADDVVF